MFDFLSSLFSNSPNPISSKEIRDQLEQERIRFLIADEKIDAAKLIEQHPPHVEHKKKKILFDAALRDKANGPLHVERYSEITLPKTFTPFEPTTEVLTRKGYFKYETDKSADHWHMNFADHSLFNFYGHYLLAQDEIQVAEHPALASVREMMLMRNDGLKPLTVEYHSPTPILIRGVQRTIAIDTRSIYGSRFAGSEDSVIKESIRLISPPSVSNIVAIEAPTSSGNTIYSHLEIEAALRTAYSGYRAVVINSVLSCDTMKPIVLHGGNWGCGAYGGNRQLMVTIQMIAASLAGISKIIFHCGADSMKDVDQWKQELESQFKFRLGADVQKLIHKLASANFSWGTPDGN